jgi:signal peptidase
MKIRKIIKITLLIVIVTIVAVFLIFFRPVALGGDTLYEPVFTGSMEPAVPVGSVVVIKPVDPNTLQKGDIICFKLSGPLSVTHRIINITNEGFITKGDGNNAPDIWTVGKENVIGKLILIIPYIGYIGYLVKTPLGFLLLIIIPATLLIILEIKNIIKYRKEAKNPTTQKATTTPPTQTQKKTRIKIPWKK